MQIRSDRPDLRSFKLNSIRACLSGAAPLPVEVQQGFEKVYHLRGGILKYLEVIPREDSLWQGSCFVFDEREGLTHGLAITKQDGG